MTVRELSSALFDVIDQDLTIRELRSLLFKADDQDAEVDMFLLDELISANNQQAAS